MVCEKCTQKLSKLATVHAVNKNPLTGSSSRITNENKLLSSKQKFKPATEEYKKCRICKHRTHHVCAHYCQNCAFQKGICPMCGRKVIETATNRQSLV